MSYQTNCPRAPPGSCTPQLSRGLALTPRSTHISRFVLFHIVPALLRSGTGARQACRLQLRDIQQKDILARRVPVAAGACIIPSCNVGVSAEFKAHKFDCLPEDHGKAW